MESPGVDSNKFHKEEIVRLDGVIGDLRARAEKAENERDLLHNEVKQLHTLIKKYVRHIQDCEGVHYIDRTDGSGRSKLTDEDQRMLLNIARVQEDY